MATEGPAAGRHKLSVFYRERDATSRWRCYVCGYVFPTDRILDEAVDAGLIGCPGPHPKAPD